jgi:hypothetical protein
LVRRAATVEVLDDKAVVGTVRQEVQFLMTKLRFSLPGFLPPGVQRPSGVFVGIPVTDIQVVVQFVMALPRSRCARSRG